MVHCAFFNDFDFQTEDCVKVLHRGYLLAEKSDFGPSSCGGIATDGKCTVILRQCVIEGTGRGEDPDKDTDTSWADEIVTQGEHPAISLSYACDLCLDQCTIRNNYGYAIQWADVDEENGTTDQKLIDEGTPAEFADKSAADREKSVSNAIFARFIKDNLGIDVRTEEGKKQMREREINTRTEELAEIPAKRKRGSVVCMDCICKANARSAHLDDGADEMTGDIIPIQPWFREGSRMKKVLDSCP
mmetsp:Transcript_29253/g.59318  ORF Transcript_29253/g.59318 Transcript_29253/m.59318 type:complete len:245 (-) Transcript_29253:1037-1771(-)